MTTTPTTPTALAAIPPQDCPGCGHSTTSCIAGHCTAMVPGPPGGPLAVYCDHDCHQAITGVSLPDLIAQILAGEVDR